MWFQSGRQRSLQISLNNWHYDLQLQMSLIGTPSLLLFYANFFLVPRLQLTGGEHVTHATWQWAVSKMRLTWRNVPVKIALHNNTVHTHSKLMHFSWWMRFQLIAVVWVLICQHPSWAALNSDISSKFCRVRTFPRLSAASIDGCRR